MAAAAASVSQSQKCSSLQVNQEENLIDYIDKGRRYIEKNLQINENAVVLILDPNRSVDLYPSIINKNNVSFVFINANFAFNDETDLARLYYRDFIVKKAKQLKFLLAVNLNDFNNEVKQLIQMLISVDSSKEFPFKSIGLLIKEANDIMDDESLEHQVESAFIEEDDPVSESVRTILNQNKLSRFSTELSAQLIKMVDELEFVQASSIQIRRNVSATTNNKLTLAIVDCSNELRSSLENILTSNITALFDGDGQETESRARFVETFATDLFRITSLDKLLDILDPMIFNEQLNSDFRMRNEILGYLNELLDNPHRCIVLEKQWLSLRLLKKVNDLNQKYGNQNVGPRKDFVKYFDSFADRLIKLEKLTHSYVNRSLREANQKSELSDLIRRVESIKRLNDSEFEDLSSASSDNLLSDLKSQIEILSSAAESKNETDSTKIFNENMNKLIQSIESFILNEKLYILDDHLVFKGHFSSVGDVIDAMMIEKSNQLKSIRIYVTHAFLLDRDFKLNKSFYQESASDLIIVAPKVLISNRTTITIDLSCENKPKMKSRAANGNKESKNGLDGENGATGYNGGRLIIYANQIENAKNLNFISLGGDGGDGQNGGFGAVGNRGKDIVNIDCANKHLKKCASDNNLDGIDANECIRNVCTDLHFAKKMNTLSNHKKYIYCALGGDGGNGGRAGAGGAGGNHGLNGYSILRTSQLYAYSEYRAKMPNNGYPGGNGLPGKGGEPGYNLCKSVRVNSWHRVDDEPEFEREFVWEKTANFGQKGPAAQYSNDLLDQKAEQQQPKYSTDIELNVILSEYKEFSRNYNASLID